MFSIVLPFLCKGDVFSHLPHNIFDVLENLELKVQPCEATTVICSYSISCNGEKNPPSQHCNMFFNTFKTFPYFLTVLFITLEDFYFNISRVCFLLICEITWLLHRLIKNCWRKNGLMLYFWPWSTKVLRGNASINSLLLIDLNEWTHYHWKPALLCQDNAIKKWRLKENNHLILNTKTRVKSNSWL